MEYSSTIKECKMSSDSVNVRIGGPLRDHLNQQIGRSGLYENASEYVRDLIRRDLKDKDAAWAWLQRELEPGLRADESEFVEVSADDVIRRNTERSGR